MNRKEHIQAPNSKPTPPHILLLTHCALASDTEPQNLFCPWTTLNPGISNLLLAWFGGFSFFTVICPRLSQRKLLCVSYQPPRSHLFQVHVLQHAPSYQLNSKNSAQLEETLSGVTRHDTNFQCISLSLLSPPESQRVMNSTTREEAQQYIKAAQLR